MESMVGQIDSIAGIAGIFFGTAFGSFATALYKNFFRIYKKDQFYKELMAKTIERNANGHANGHANGNGGTLYGNPLVDMEERLAKQIDLLAKTGACNFSEIYQEHLKCFHDLRSNEFIGRKDLIEALEKTISVIRDEGQSTGTPPDEWAK